jgi:hypothetical protein|uniref:MYM-type domain-containing protein n=1 Tax=viral metagenome TaxID=1070528 RepID=A0A6C0AKW9_9ZZZZ
MPRKKKIENTDAPPVVKKKRGRKPKKQSTEPVVPPVKKKRGRKPKGGKLIKKSELKLNVNVKQPTNIILHLKCKKSEICSTVLMSTGSYNPDINNLSDPTAYQLNSNSKLQNLNFQKLKVNENTNTKPEQIVIFDNKKNKEPVKDEEDINVKEIWIKLDHLKNKLRHNNVSDKKSACFWCTCNFDNPAIHIPIKYENNSYEVYGCFCCPECAVAHLKNENIDASTLWERYSLINNIYSKIYNYTINIKPAPNPYYTLEKYYGNLTINEYRKLLQNDKLLMIVDKPMTKILPELYEENNDIPNVYSNLLDNNNKTRVKSKEYRLKRKKVTQNKNQILSSNFNF